MFLENKVIFPTPTIKLHWPAWWCDYCGQETVVVQPEIYWCPSCDRYSSGRTQLIEGKVRML